MLAASLLALMCHRNNAEHAAAHHSRENAGWGFAAAERSSCWAYVVVLGG